MNSQPFYKADLHTEDVICTVILNRYLQIIITYNISFQQKSERTNLHE